MSGAIGSIKNGPTAPVSRPDAGMTVVKPVKEREVHTPGARPKHGGAVCEDVHLQGRSFDRLPFTPTHDASRSVSVGRGPCQRTGGIFECPY